MKVLIVEDEVKVNDFIKKGLEEEGFTVDAAFNGMEALKFLNENRYDVVILDIMLPELDGNEVLKRMRDKGDDTPVIMLTAKDELDDKIKSFNIGCDDYITKPFSLEELLLRIKAVMRRKGVDKEVETKLQYKDLTLDLIARKAFRGDKEIELTSKEFSLLELLMRKPEEILPRNFISEKVWGYDFDTMTNIIDVYINHLRNKIDKGFDKKLIHTIRGVGYILKEE